MVEERELLPDQHLVLGVDPAGLLDEALELGREPPWPPSGRPWARARGSPRCRPRRSREPELRRGGARSAARAPARGRAAGPSRPGARRAGRGRRRRRARGSRRSGRRRSRAAASPRRICLARWVTRSAFTGIACPLRFAYSCSARPSPPLRVIALASASGSCSIAADDRGVLVVPTTRAPRSCPTAIVLHEEGLEPERRPRRACAPGRRRREPAPGAGRSVEMPRMSISGVISFSICISWSCIWIAFDWPSRTSAAPRSSRPSRRRV